jgi:two-component system sensor histidine kinase UhpB
MGGNETERAGPGLNPCRPELTTSVADTLSAIPLLDSTPHGIVLTTAEGQIEFANRLAVELVGFAREELRGRHLDTLLKGGIEDYVADQPYETTCHRADGTEVPVEVRVGSMGTQGWLVVTLRDGRDLRARNDASIKTEAKLRALVEQISAITYTWTWRDADYLVVYCSPQIEGILGYTAAEWIADPAAWYAWVHPEDRPAVIAENKRCEQTAEAYSMQYRMIRKDDRIIWVEDSWVVVEDELDGRRVFQGVVFDITERKLAEREIAFLAHHTISAGEQERKRLAAEIHDGPIQQLTALGVTLHMLRGHLDEADQTPAALADRAQGGLERSISELRQMMVDLHPPALRERGLDDALLDWLGGLRTSSDVRCHLQNTLEGRLTPDIETTLYRIIQEALANVVKHAKAKNAWVSLQPADRQVELEVRDDGAGMSLDSGDTSLNGDHYGLISMRERAEMVGGTWEIFSAPDNGTRIRVCLPMEVSA